MLLFKKKRGNGIILFSFCGLLIFLTYGGYQMISTISAPLNLYMEYTHDAVNSTFQAGKIANTTVPQLVIIEGAQFIEYLPFSENKLWYQEKLAHTEDLPLSMYTNGTKRILIWTEPFDSGGSPTPFVPDRENWFQEFGCPVWQCEVTTFDHARKNLNDSGIPVEDFDAVIFHDPFWRDRNDVPAKRSPHQRYIFWTQEPPSYHTFLNLWNEASGFFNWTMTYRWDSDIVAPYGFTRKSTEIEIRNEKNQLRPKKGNYAQGKSKMAIWICTNPGNLSGRKSYVDQLQKHIQIDIYGPCGGNKLQCPYGRECREMMARDYKFYIAIENSFCRDYVTEKLFYNMRYNVIPIVIDLHQNHARFAPPRSYINALDFSTVKELADYLQILDKNDTQYNEYFLWKKHYVTEYDVHPWEGNIYEESSRGLCGLCSKLHDPSQPISIYTNITKWWYTDSTCKIVDTKNSTDGTWEIRDSNAPIGRQFG